MAGQFEHIVDAKGRFNFPAKLRAKYGEHFYITKSIYDKCLVVYNEEGWTDLEKKLSDLPTESGMPLRRYLIGGACEAEPDKQGRVAITASLRKFAGIETDIIVVDNGSCAEIWDTALWNEYNSEYSQDAIAKLAKKVKI